MFDFLLRLGVRWLDRHGLPHVAASLENGLAENGDLKASLALARRALNDHDPGRALGVIEAALTRTPDAPMLWCLKGTSHRMALHFDAAMAAYQRSLELAPDLVPALNNMGELQLVRLQAEAALALFDQVLRIDPHYLEARINRIAALFELNRLDGLQEEARRVTEDAPDSAEAFGNLGNILLRMDAKSDAIQCYQRALVLRPGYPEAHFNLAILQSSSKDLGAAIDFLHMQIEAQGVSAFRLALLAAACHAAGRLTQAEIHGKAALALDPGNVAANMSLAATLAAAGNPAAALDVYARALVYHPAHPGIGSNVNFESNNLPHLGPEEIFRRHAEWAASQEPADLTVNKNWPHSRAPGRRLRVGYVSGDFCAHPVGYLLRDVLKFHDKQAFEIYCFSTSVRPDDVTETIRLAADHWIEAHALNDDALVSRVEDIQIDILVDLSGHTAFNRLQVFARQPCPVQATWIGYFHSTGMRSIGYFITDPHTSPADSRQHFSETPVYLPHTRFCYSPPAYAPTVTPLPLLTCEHITLGSFNRVSKLNEQVLAAWIDILKRVPKSRLVLKAAAFSEPPVCDRILQRFVQGGIQATRVDLREASGHRDMLAEYSEIDIALDTFPFNGGMTTLEALWMGVPVVTLAGNTVVSRQTVSALANLGLDGELAFDSVEAYVAGAVALAHDPARLAELRRELRPRMAASPLRDAERFTRDLEALYRRMWEAWCQGTRLDAYSCEVV